MHSNRRVTVGIIVATVFLFAGATAFCQTGGDGKVSMTEWTKIIETKVAEQAGDKGIINYEDGYVEAIGIGAPPERYLGKPNARPMALRAAKLDAYRNILEVIKGVRVDSNTVVRDFMTENDEIRTSVEGVVRNFTVVNQDYMSDGTIEVTVRMNLSGRLSQTVLPKGPEPEPSAAPAPAPAAPTTDSVTGLVIDARGLAARPAMSPKIVDENGKEVYGSMQVDRQYAIQQGMTGYARDLTAAQSNPRVTSNPLSVKGIRADGPGKCDIIISNADAAKVRASAEAMNYLQKCRVMIVLD
ncbi:MAG TPA: LPP20 family lipoprotein [Syntrophales bacterium]|nr:LPP20 family lipoprotein [Syntrophales bacterium]HOD98220.1 LPP20 family lipoprotein [Syntrophales bacterium]HOH72411.1 LPP20 family lipoprotein [Syntrophales bacterium]HPX82758.1 LPP20 family lipoprotein [Syntrophales bacterium]